ncbi:multinuclear nonheme iron-dependent oxidase, partial [Luteibacter sp.]|uniref:multinuclear nonheme iron-dependent oxidase n=1 Tax=Luteibacter sp. TaxID=1886636 RepID=UPI003F7FCA2C
MSTATLPPFAGFGLGLRVPHYQDVLETRQPLDFVEVISENFMVDGGRPLHVLEQVRSL